ncbi:MAG: hypothetical protein NZ530_00340 [Thermodesulfobacteriaceae bacterium]|nr:hypothetical protein [Thermodesulfobacteriaceae bacterium]MCX8041955.1 hypothetical protein [Thermodesulfobacteriaceae bacterium]MDW8136238.1 LptA/OstA family protein [Thermodesulfobacterium sp.]
MERYIFNIFNIFIFIFSFYSLLLAASEIKVDADKMEVLESEGLVVFTGNVEATRKDLKVWTEKLYIYYNNSKEDKKTVTKLVALGRVRIQKGKWQAYAGKAVYFRDQDFLVLEEEPKVWYENHLVEGDVIKVYFKEDRSEVLAKKGGRVRASVTTK